MIGETGTNLERILQSLAGTLLDPLGGNLHKKRKVSGWVIYDADEESELPAHALVLGIGLRRVDDICAVLETLGDLESTALIVRSPVEPTPELDRAISASGVALLGLPRGASWTQLAAMLRTLTTEIGSDDQDAGLIGGLPSGDLFALANAIAALIRAPVTIEDLNFNVLAFSGEQDKADRTRIESILGRHVPERFTGQYKERGLLDELYRAGTPIHIPRDEVAGDDPEAVGRTVIAIRAGSRPLGSIWAAVDGEFDEQRTQAFIDSAKLAAPHLLRARTDEDVERRVRTDLMRSALTGGAPAAEALGRLGLQGKPVVVLALGVETPSAPRDAASHTSDLERVGDALALHLAAFQPLTVVAIIGNLAYALVPLRRGASDTGHLVEIATSFLERTRERIPAFVGIGSIVHNASELSDSRARADRALRVLMSTKPDRLVAAYSDLQIDSLLLEITDLLLGRNETVGGAIERLLAYDAKHGAELVRTLKCWLEAFGDVSRAASLAFVHANTFRYRLRRLSEVGGIDLDDHDDRFSAMLHLRLIDMARGGESSSPDED